MLTYLLILAFVLLAVGLVAFLLKEDRGTKKPVGSLWMAVGFGVLGAIFASLIEKKFVPLSDISTGAPLSVLFRSFLSVGVIEECLKFLPLAIFIYHKKYFKEHVDGVIFFALAGLGFGLPENILYTLQYGAKAGMGRLILTPLFHAAITAMVGYQLANAKIEKKNPFTIWPYLLLAILLHAIYDFGLSAGTNIFVFISVTITLALSINFFYLFFKAKDIDEDEGLEAVGHNNFCRSCGFVNSHHYLYCTHCGKRA